MWRNNNIMKSKLKDVVYQVAPFYDRALILSSNNNIVETKHRDVVYHVASFYDGAQTL